VLEHTLQLAIDRFGANDFREAERLCEAVLSEAPEHPVALHLLGVSRLRGGRAEQAVAPLRQALRADPANLAALEALSAALAATGDHRQAEGVVRQMLAAGARLPVVSLRLGLTLAHQGRWDEALSAFEDAARGDPEMPEAHYHVGLALLELKRPGESLTALERALALDPRHAEALNAAGLVLQSLARTEEAIAAFRRASSVDGSHAGAHENLGRALLDEGRLEEARLSLERALALNGDNANALCNLGVVLQEQGRWADAAVSLERALAIDPGYDGAAYNLGLARLHLRQFDDAWVLHERRLSSDGIRERLRKDAATVARFESLPHWQGPAERGTGELAVWAEQGIGEQLLYSTLIPDLVEQGVRFVYEVDARLLAAYERAFPGSQFAPWRDPPDAPLQGAGQVLFAGSLPGFFRRTRESFARQPRRLLSALPERVAHYRGRLAALGPGLKVALSWRSTRGDRLGPRKSVPLSRFTDLVKLADAHFVDVQYGDTDAERAAVEAASGVRLARFGDVDHFRDLEEVLAILSACDLLITTSNATAHFAGALGKRAWLLFPADNPPFFYWTHDDQYRSDWYPSVEIVSRTELKEWPALIRFAADKLARLAAG